MDSFVRNHLKDSAQLFLLAEHFKAIDDPIALSIVKETSCFNQIRMKDLKDKTIN